MSYKDESMEYEIMSLQQSVGLVKDWMELEEDTPIEDLVKIRSIYSLMDDLVSSYAKNSIKYDTNNS